VGPKKAVPFGKAGNFLKFFRKGIYITKHIPAGLKEVQLVGGYQSAQRQGVGFEKFRDFPVFRGRGMQGKVYAFYFRFYIKGLRPFRKDFHYR
jgi:hypothetical protein